MNLPQAALPLQYVCLSDLHLGAINSLLADGRKDPDLCCLDSFAQALRASVSKLSSSGSLLPTLIIHGDLLDMGLATMKEVELAYECFVKALFQTDSPPVFSKHILLVPGNHDHHLWRMCRDRYLLEVGYLLDATSLFLGDGCPPVLCPFLTGLTRRSLGDQFDAETKVQVAYPNLGLLNPERSRCLLIHHGHYTDSPYLAMSTLSRIVRRALQPRAAPMSLAAPVSVEQIERLNGPWVDFLWSDLGSAGALGSTANTLYEALYDANASRQLMHALGNFVLKHLSALGFEPSIPLAIGLTLGQVLQGAVDASLGWAAQSERYAATVLATPTGLAHLQEYLAGPLLEQLRKAMPGPLPKDVSFIYGHTHKPFQDELAVPGYEQPVAVYNTGGWVMDQPTLCPIQGASVLLIDTDLHVAALRLFNDSPNDFPLPHVEGLGGFRDNDEGAKLWLNAVRSTIIDIEQHTNPWRAFSKNVQTAIQLQADKWMDQWSSPPDVNPNPSTFEEAQP